VGTCGEGAGGRSFSFIEGGGSSELQPWAEPLTQPDCVSLGEHRVVSPNNWLLCDDEYKNCCNGPEGRRCVDGYVPNEGHADYQSTDEGEHQCSPSNYECIPDPAAGTQPALVNVSPPSQSTTCCGF
jgi:hypothetical protein